MSNKSAQFHNIQLFVCVLEHIELELCLLVYTSRLCRKGYEVSKERVEEWRDLNEITFASKTTKNFLCKGNLSPFAYKIKIWLF
jgi:hypothetical protein